MAFKKSAFKKLGSKFGINVAQNAVGFGVGQVLGSVLAPETQALLNDSWPLDPNMPVSPQELAAMVVQGVLPEDIAVNEAAKSGISDINFHRLVLVNGSPPGPEDLLSMWDRGIIGEADVRRGLLQSRIKPEWVDAVIATNPALIQVADLAEMVVQGVILQDEGAKLASLLSYSADQFDKLVRLAGSPPGPQESLTMWNRGIMSEDDVNLAILQSRLKPEWLDKFKELRYQPLSVSTAVDAVVRSRMTPDEGRAIAEQNGLTAENFDKAVDITGRSMGVMQAITLARRGELDYQGFFDIVARSDVKTDYAPDLWKLRVALPSIIQVKQLVQAGSIPDDMATTILEQEGYSHDIATGVVKAAHTTKSTATKHVSAGTIEALFIAGIESHDVAVKALEQLKYSEDDANAYLEAWAARRVASEIIHGVTITRTKYTTWKINEPEARADLADFALDNETITRLLRWWADERHALRPQLTHGMITTGFKYGRYTYDEATQLLLGQGWDAAGALTLLWNTVHGDPRPGASATAPGTPVTVTSPPPGFSGVDTSGTT